VQVVNEVSKDETDALWYRSLDVYPEEVAAPVSIRLLRYRVRADSRKRAIS
jgi:hypothetical protein